MYKSYWSMEFNPFNKEISEKNCFKSKDYNQAFSRLEHLKNIKGIGLFTGLSGTGKTYTLRCFANSLNPNLYKVVYTNLSTVTVLEFYKSLAYGLGTEVFAKKVDLFKSIQERIVNLSKSKKITPVIIIDEAQYLKTDILNDLKLLLNFQMDSKDHAILILSGQPVLNSILSKQIHEALKQRIVIKYNYEGINKEEIRQYMEDRLNICGVYNKIFEDNALEAISSCCNNSTRLLNSIVEKCLIIGWQKNLKSIDTEVVMLAQNEMNLI